MQWLSSVHKVTYRLCNHTQGFVCHLNHEEGHLDEMMPV